MMSLGIRRSDMFVNCWMGVMVSRFDTWWLEIVDNSWVYPWQWCQWPPWASALLCADFKLFSNEVLVCNTITTIKTFQECHLSSLPDPGLSSLGNDKIFIISPFPYFCQQLNFLNKAILISSSCFPVCWKYWNLCMMMGQWLILVKDNGWCVFSWWPLAH